MIKLVFRIRIGFNADRQTYPAFLINADPDLDPDAEPFPDPEFRRPKIEKKFTVKCPYFGHLFDFATFFHCQLNFCAHYLLHTKHV